MSSVILNPFTGQFQIGSTGGGGGSGANTSLSNLTSPTAVNQNLIFDTGSAATIKTKDNDTIDPKNLIISTGDASALGSSSGSMTIQTGTSADSVSGDTTITTGAAVHPNRRTGETVISSGVSIDGASGNVHLSPGIPSGSGTRGTVILDAVLVPSSDNTKAIGADGTNFSLVFARGFISSASGIVQALNGNLALSAQGGTDVRIVDGTQLLWATGSPFNIATNSAQDINLLPASGVVNVTANILSADGSQNLGNAIGNGFEGLYINKVRSATGSVVLDTSIHALENTFGAVLEFSTASEIKLREVHLASNQQTPTAFTVGSQAGTGSSVTDITTGSVSTDTAGRIRITAGTGAGVGDYALVTFNQAFTNDCIVILTPANDNASQSLAGLYTTTDASSFTIFAASLSPGDYDFNYHVIGVQ